ncbi:hypothetical protein CC80DRAFT_594277 [Byssothecium circinans]|uniref:Uncharacterized protein n=1 Tax=Byssothecium circinans TaxID=147558 RepID=A0A6A5TTB3_9PLEO|nr:hypothetical protein CC80DRAFT_594277 [Byssothecium circinans]
MRLTRAALRAEAEAQQPVIETADASNAHSDPKGRVPLGEVSTNTAIEPEVEHPQSQKMPPKKRKAKGGARGKKGKGVDEVEVADVLEDERAAAGSPASDAAVDELAKEPNDDHLTDGVDGQQRPASPPRAVRMTRRQLAKQQDELTKSLRSRGPAPTEPVEIEFENTIPGAQAESTKPQETPAVEEAPAEPYAETVEENPVTVAEEQAVEEPQRTPVKAKELVETPVATVQEVQGVETNAPAEIQVPVEPTPVETPEEIAPSVEVSEPEPKTLSSEKPCEGEATPVASRTSTRPSSRSPSKSPMRLEESIEAFDALEEALENVGTVIPKFDQSGDEKSPSKKAFPDTTSRRPPLGSKVSRNSSIAPRSLKPAAPRGSLARSSSVRVAPSKERKGSEVTDYLASKRRPISMSFPTPPPAQKSTRAPTKATFQLSGEAVAAKLKAQKEERLKREAEAGPAKPRPISMPPPPKSTKPPTKPNFQLPGEAVAAKLKTQKEERLRREAEGEIPTRPNNLPAPLKSTKPPTVANFQLPGEAIAAKLKAQKEERLRREAEGEQCTSRPISLPPPPKSTKAPTVPNFQLPGEAIAAKLKAQREERLKREEEAEAARKAQASSFKARPAPVRKPPAPVRQTASSAARLNGMAIENAANKRNSVTVSRSTSNASFNRKSTALGTSRSLVAPTDAAALKLRGKEVFNRDKIEKEARDKERREKEEAAKRARAEAAERGRIASREWAEKQKRKLMAARAEAA